MSTRTMRIEATGLTGLERTTLVQVRELEVSDCEELSQLYLDSYPPGVAAGSLEEAQAEMRLAFDGGFGQLIPEATLGAFDGDRLIGAVMTVVDPPWDDVPPGPFIIELFVAPDARSQGVATALLSLAAENCSRQGQDTLSLRVDMHTASEAFRLYEFLGFATVE
ncbi:GNAT family N-acetyltransferase [Buchananella hordeovulneris]|uniref:N-acetyltransferase domain-containing protein n=1 Tax=Buchananella hordeovulneris TaxID=52770 RepID=A0A1Q5PX57_9ACTO|nr:GNAT family N-acetyltransferase [Buchananella hordeovulneris]MDO5080160.1 GNAT family N-acetyltransferase [Buchananella hordeovulneris]OKL52086.1 hypothetical protein BSZ40_04050 [Buchananella hordeovulneris]